MISGCTELSRVVVPDKTKNAASFLISHSLQMLESPCAVVNYADMERNHCGIIYQATNWIYTGSTVSHDKLYILDGKQNASHDIARHGDYRPYKMGEENRILTVEAF